MRSQSVSVRFRLARLGWRARLFAMRTRGRATSLDMVSLTDFYKDLWTAAANELSARITELGPGFWRIQRGLQSTLIHNYIVPIDDPVVLNVAGDKGLCHRILADQGLPVPEHELFTLAEFDKALRFMARYPRACFVVKPAMGTSGARGVTTHISGERECRKASALASLYGSRILIERWIPGESYRLLFLDGELIHASRRRGLRVVGDGRSTLGELIGDAGSETHEIRDVAQTLASQELTLVSVPARGVDVLARSAQKSLAGSAQVRTVFDEDATAEIGPDLRGQAARAVRAIGSDFAGVDIITRDPAHALETTGGVINEINTTPGLHHHYGLSGPTTALLDPAQCVLARLLGTHARTRLAQTAG